MEELPATGSGYDPTDIASDNMYRMSHGFLDEIQACQLSANAHRVLHVLLHATCRSQTTWSSEASDQPEDGFRQTCIALRRVAGLEAAKGNRALTSAAEELRKTGLFEFINFHHGNEWMTWRFSDHVLRLLFERHEGYGLLDASILPLLKSRLDFLIYAEVALVRRMRRARMTFHCENFNLLTGGQNATWSHASSRILKVLKIICQHHDLSMYLLLDCQGILHGIDTVTVRIRRKSSLWTVKDLAKTNPTTRRYLILDQSGHEEVARANIVARVGNTMARRKPLHTTFSKGL